MSDEQDEQLVVLREPFAEIAERALDVRARRSRNGRRLLFTKHDDAIVGIAEFVAQHLGERYTPLVVFLRVRITTRCTRDDERVVVARRRRSSEREHGHERESDSHRRPHRRRRIHSADSAAATKANVHGACHTSRCSGAAF